MSLFIIVDIQRKPQTCWKSLANIIPYMYTVLSIPKSQEKLVDMKLRLLVAPLVSSKLLLVIMTIDVLFFIVIYIVLINLITCIL
jgi:hypothetical protein